MIQLGWGFIYMGYLFALRFVEFSWAFPIEESNQKTGEFCPKNFFDRESLKFNFANFS
jgi:hypothetical protein